MPSFSEDELTHLMPSKSINAVLPAAGRPATVPPPAHSRPASVPPPARSSRAQRFVDDDEGRTVVRGAPKIVKRAATNSQPPPKMGLPTAPTTISPAAVIKATLEAAQTAKRNDLMAGPPRDLLEDAADVHPADAGPQRTVQMSDSGAIAQMSTQALQPQALPMPSPSVRSVPPPAPSYPPPPAPSYPQGVQAVPSYPPPPMSYPGGVYPAAANSAPAVSVPGMAMPAPSMPPHFMVPQAPYSDARMDPPGTSVTSRHKVAGRPAISWAAALLAFGLFVGVGAVAVMQGTDGVAETTASFVDPSRAPGNKPAAAAQPAPAPAEPAVTAAPVAVPAEPAPPPAAPPPAAPPPAADPNAPPPVAAGAAPASPATGVTGAAAPPPAAPPGVIGASTPPAAAPPAAAPPAAAPTTEAVAKVDPKPTPAPAATFKPPPRTWSPPPAPAPKAAPAEDAEPKKTATAKKGGGKGGEDDAEMKRALEQLQKSQLERSLGE